MNTSSQLFIHLRSFSQFTPLKSTLAIDNMAELCAAYRMPALALTDHNNVFAAISYSHTLSRHGIQPIIGSHIDVKSGQQTLGGWTFLVQFE